MNQSKYYTDLFSLAYALKNQFYHNQFFTKLVEIEIDKCTPRGLIGLLAKDINNKLNKYTVSNANENCVFLTNLCNRKTIEVDLIDIDDHYNFYSIISCFGDDCEKKLLEQKVLLKDKMKIIEELKFDKKTNREIWDKSIEDVKKLADNSKLEDFDNALYYTFRLFKKSIDLRKENFDEYFENESELRNYYLEYTDFENDGYDLVLVTGFDPWYEQSNFSNFSGTIALSLHDEIFTIEGKSKQLKIISCILPNRWKDFEAGLIDKIALRAKELEVKQIISLGMGFPNKFTNEYYAINNKVGKDNENNAPDNNEFDFELAQIFYTSLNEGILDINLIKDRSYSIVDYNKESEDVEGTGGAYFCNAAFYNFSKFKTENNCNYKNGFIHMPPEINSCGKADINLAREIILQAIKKQCT